MCYESVCVKICLHGQINTFVKNVNNYVWVMGLRVFFFLVKNVFNVDMYFQRKIIQMAKQGSSTDSGNCFPNVILETCQNMPRCFGSLTVLSYSVSLFSLASFLLGLQRSRLLVTTIKRVVWSLCYLPVCSRSLCTHCLPYFLPILY